MYGQYDPYFVRLLSGEPYEGDEDGDLQTKPPVDPEVVRWSLIAVTALALLLLFCAIVLG